MLELEKVVNEIVNHAQTGPAPEGQRGVVRNTLSPHYPRLVRELVRKVVIQSAQDAGKQIAQELIALKNILPEQSQGQLDLSAARINQIISSIYK